MNKDLHIHLLQEALYSLLKFCVSGDRYKQANPYLIDEITTGLKTLNRTLGLSDTDYQSYFDAIQNYEKYVGIKGES